MLDKMSTDEFEERFAHYLLSPWDRPFEAAAITSAMVHNVMNNYMWAKAGKPVPKSSILEPDALIPKPNWAREEEAKISHATAESVEDLAKNLGCF